MLAIPVVLGSATPSLESLANAARGKYTRIVLPDRVDQRPLPIMRVVDLRREAAAARCCRARCVTALAERLERKEQALLFLNRRGHSHHTQCRECGWVPTCPNCDIALTLHLAPRERRCHYCDHRRARHRPVPELPGGAAQALGRRHPARRARAGRGAAAARIMRLDTDVARDRGAPAQVLQPSRAARATCCSAPR